MQKIRYIVLAILMLGMVGVIAFIIVRAEKTVVSVIYSPRILSDVKSKSYYENFSLESEGVKIKGLILNPSTDTDIAVIIAPGYQGSKELLLPLAEFFRDNGFLSVVFDPRGEGESDGEIYALGAFEDEDIEAIMDYLENSRGISQFVLFGISCGATASIIASARNQGRVIATIADSPFANILIAQGDGFFKKLWVRFCNFWGRIQKGIDLYKETNSLSCVEKVSHIMLIHCIEDRTLHFKNSVLLYNNAQEPKELWLVDKLDHVQAISYRTEEYLRRILNFIQRCLREGSMINRALFSFKSQNKLHRHH